MFGGVGDVVPFCQLRRVFRTMTDENAQVMQPGGGIKHVIIKRLAARKLLRQMIKARLMTEFVRRVGVRPNVVGDGLAISRLVHRGKITTYEQIEMRNGD